MPLTTRDGIPSRHLADPRRNGIALVSVLFILVGLLALTATLFLSLFLDYQATSNVSAGDDALYVAEAGIQHLWSLLKPATDFSRELAWPDGAPPFGSPTGFPEPPRTYRVRVDGLAGGRLRARSEGTSHRGARRAVEAVFVREPQFRPPAALTIAEATLPTDLSGVFDVSADEAVGELPAYGAESRASAEAFRGARGDITEVAIVGSSGLGNAIDRLRETSRITLDGQDSGAFGSTEEPLVVRFAGVVEIPGTIKVSGIVLADAPLRVRGRLEVDGLLLAPQGIDVDGVLAIGGAAWIAGDVRVSATGELAARYSAEALDRSDEAAPGILPRGAILGAWREVW